jgi:hypothetical protein
MGTRNSVVVGRSEGKRQLGRTRYWWEDNIKMDLKNKLDLIHVAHDRG